MTFQIKASNCICLSKDESQYNNKGLLWKGKIVVSLQTGEMNNREKGNVAMFVTVL